MIIDFSCRETLGFLDFVAPAIPGALIVFIVVSGLAFIGRLVTRSSVFHASDIFAGWGIVAAIMTVASVFFVKPLLISAFGIFGLALIGLFFCMKGRYFSAPFWILALFPGLFVLVAINAIGIGGGYFYDDYSHWAPNALFVFLHDDVPSKALPSIYSLYPGYPYALPFLTYLASLLAGGFLVQGGAMINFMLLLGFAALLAETFQKPSSKKAVSWSSMGFTALALVFAVFMSSTISTFGITNQGDTGTMALCGALGLMFWRMSESLRSKRKTNDVRELLLPLSLTAVAFVLLKQSNIVLLLLLAGAFLTISWRNGVLKKAAAKLPLVLLPAIALRLLWQYYVQTEMEGGGVGIASLSAWRFDLFIPLLHGIWEEILWKSVFFALFIATMGCGLFCLFRPPAPERNFAIFAALVEAGYAAFLVLAFLGSDFTEYTIKLAASFHRYMLHAVFLALPAFWIAAHALWPDMKKKIKIPAFLSAKSVRKGSVVLILFVLPAVMVFRSDWVVLQADLGTCTTRMLAQRAAAVLPEGTKLGVVFPKDTGYSAFVVGFDLALEEARSGRSMALLWHGDNFHTFSPLTKEDVEKQFKGHPETNALIFTPEGYALLKELGYTGNVDSGFLVREQGKWKSRRLSPVYPPP
jgi:hypothetical protein